MRLATLAVLLPFLVSACSTSPDIPSSRPSDLATPSADAEAPAIRAALRDDCSGPDLKIAMEGFAILARTSRAHELTEQEQATLAARDEAYRAQRDAISPGCQAEINKLV